MRGVAEVMEVLTVKRTFYLEWRSLCLAGINCSLIRYRWDLWEECLFSLCQLTSLFSVSACTELAGASKIQYTQYYMTRRLFSAFKSHFIIWQLHFGVLVFLTLLPHFHRISFNSPTEMAMNLKGTFSGENKLFYNNENVEAQFSALNWQVVDHLKWYQCIFYMHWFKQFTIATLTAHCKSY